MARQSVNLEQKQ